MEEPGAALAPVLIIDDDAASAKLLKVLLRAEGYLTRTAASAEQALPILEELTPSAIVVDLVLPLMSGLLLTQRLKADARMRDVPVIAVTAFNGDDLERLALRAGCCAFVRKPIDPSSFTQLITEHIGVKP